eukprot:286760_1
MSTVGEQLIEISKLLIYPISEQSVYEIKSKILSIADNLKISYASITNKDIDDILDELDHNEQKENPKESTSDFTFTASIISSAQLFANVLYGLDSNNNFTETMWLLLFKKANDIDKNLQWKAKCDPFVPFGNKFNNVSNDELLAIYNEIPPHLLKDLFAQREEFWNWWREHQRKKKSVYKEIFNRINQTFMDYTYWEEFGTKAQSHSTSKAIQFYDRHHQNIDVNQQDFGRDGMTLLHLSLETEDFYNMKETTMRWIVCLQGIDDSIKDCNGKTAMDVARETGQWNKLNILLFAKMSNKMRDKADEQVMKLDANKAVIKQWFRFYSIDNTKSDEYKFMIKLVESLKILIRKRLPLSDDMLMIGLYFEMKQNINGGNPLKTSLWKCLYNTLNNVLRIPLNRRNWLWFKQYIFGSCLWFEKLPQTQGKLLYNLLIEMVSKQLTAQKDYLVPYIERLEEKKDVDDEKKKDNDEFDDVSWEKLKNFPEFIVTDNPEGLRQDTCFDKETGKEILSPPIKPLFSNHKLHEINEKVKDFNSHNHNDVNGYLSQLILTAYCLNDIFHSSMRYIMNIKRNKNKKDGAMYMEGPVKRTERAQAKAESDYSHCSYPSTAKVVDFIRCCLVYKTTGNLLAGIDKFMNSINETIKESQNGPSCKYCEEFMEKKFKAESNDDTDCGECNLFVEKDDYFFNCTNCAQAVCMKCYQKLKTLYGIKKVLRIKNMFLDNKRENGNKWDLYKYADIKMSVLVEYNGQSMICEVQFLLDWMLEAKSLGHGLYEIERNSEFIFDIDKILSLRAGDDGVYDEDDIHKALRKAVSDGNENDVAKLILNEAPINFMKMDENGKGLIHYAIEHGQKKIMKLLLDTVKSDRTEKEFIEFINQKNDEEYTPLALTMYELKKLTRQKLSIFRLLISYEEIDVNIKVRNDKVPVLWIAINEWGKVKDLWQSLLKTGRCDLLFTKGIKNYLTISLDHKGQSYKDKLYILEQIWKSGHAQFEINHINDLLHYVVMYIYYGSIEIIKYLLSNINGIDVNSLDESKCSLLHNAVNQEWPNLDLIQYLLNISELKVDILNDKSETAGNILFAKKEKILKEKAVNGTNEKALDICPKTVDNFMNFIKSNEFHTIETPYDDDELLYFDVDDELVSD